MCNRGVADLNQSENPIDSQPNHQAEYMMDSPVSTPTGSGPGEIPDATDDTPRLKFLCSFLGSIMPRPQDGKLRYVGGETRIVSLPREVSYAELMLRMRELYEGTAVLKYQQPDEDLDALVSVVNDDDVTNMMEEYEKLGSADGFTRLRIFLFSHPEHEGSALYIDGDDRDTERRYVDALNNTNDASDFGKPPQHEFPRMNSVDDLHATEQFLNLHNLNIPPHMYSGQVQQLSSQRYSEMEAPWSPAYYSPRHHGQIDPRLADFPNSPSSARLHMPFGEYPDKVSEEYARHQVNHQAIPAYDHRPQFPDNVVWLPPGTIHADKSGFPVNILHDSNAFEGNSICEHCRVTFQRHQPQLEQPNIGNGLHSHGNQCNECHPHDENFALNGDVKMHHGIYPKEQTDPRAVYETSNHERGWVHQHQLNPLVEEARTHVTGAGRLNSHYTEDGPGVNFSPGHGNIAYAHQMPSNYNHHRPGLELSTEAFHEQVMASAPHMHILSPEECGVRYENVHYPYGTENLYPGSRGPVSGHALQRNVQSPGHGSPSYEVSTAAKHLNSQGSPRFFIGGDSQNPRIESSPKVMGFDEVIPPEYSYDLKLNPNIPKLENLHLYSPDPIRPQPDRLNIITNMQLQDSLSTLTHDKVISRVTGNNPGSLNGNNVSEAARAEVKNNQGGELGKSHAEKVEISSSQSISCPGNNIISDDTDGVAVIGSVSSNASRPVEVKEDLVKPTEKDLHASGEDSEQLVDQVMPELIASMKKVALEGVEEVKAKAEGSNGSATNEVAANELELLDANGDCGMGSENDNISTSKIEPTKAEAEAIARGLQTIRNDDLEEIRELGSGTYGAVFHGKWRGSDVAVKRIKASCFAGKPSHRERLIADFWKEALILSSLHHPNVVSFYGIVRDGPDGSLATVTEFMVNGSLKQFLQKKDRTIDRRKRLIIAMDAAFGMEYLHGKNIVHFDLKCENLLVNMRDPQRPVCKIGDLGLSKVKQHTLVSGGVRGTLPWMAPELLSGKCSMVTEKIDVYSFGIVMWELLTGDEPYADMHCAGIIGGIVNNTLRPQIPTWCDPEWKSLMQSCWACDPAERPSFSEISQKLRTMAAAINVK